MAEDNIGNSEASELGDLDDRKSSARLFRLSVQTQWVWALRRNSLALEFRSSRSSNSEASELPILSAATDLCPQVYSDSNPGLFGL